MEVARDLLGAQLCVRRVPGRIERHLITEVEAYDGFEDKASHASRGKTERNAPMYGPAGHWYVYLCYGMHWIPNVVTGSVDYPAAVQLRGVLGIDGPGRLTKRLGLNGDLSGRPAKRRIGFWFEAGQVVPESSVQRSPRIGVDYAGACASWPYRLLIDPAWQKKNGQSDRKSVKLSQP